LGSISGVATEIGGGPTLEEDAIRLIVLAGLMAFVIRALIAGLRETNPHQ
jgi:hypothetical protein